MSNGAKQLMDEIQKDWKKETILPLWTKRTMFGKIVYFPILLLVLATMSILYIGAALLYATFNLNRLTTKKEFRDEV